MTFGGLYHDIRYLHNDYMEYKLHQIIPSKEPLGAIFMLSCTMRNKIKKVELNWIELNLMWKHHLVSEIIQGFSESGKLCIHYQKVCDVAVEQEGEEEQENSYIMYTPHIHKSNQLIWFTVDDKESLILRTDILFFAIAMLSYV